MPMHTLTITTATGSHYAIARTIPLGGNVLTRTNENDVPIVNARDEVNEWALRAWSLVLDPQGQTRARFDIEGYPPLTTSPVTGIWVDGVNVLHTFLPSPA